MYDGHGGAAVARFCARHLHGELLRSEAYARGDMAGALQATYMRMDELMKTRSAELELKELAKVRGARVAAGQARVGSQAI